MKTYKTKKSVLKYAKEFLEDYHNWIQGGEFFIVPEGIDKNGPNIAEELLAKEERGEWIGSPKRAREQNEQCKVCVMGAIKMFSVDDTLARSIIQDLDEETIKAKYRYHGGGLVEEIYELNDGGAHKRPANAWKATLKVIERTLAKA